MKILNDYSIDGQFKTVDDFLDSLFEYTIPLLKTLDKYNIDLIKSYNIYNLKIVQDSRLLDIINIKGYPEISSLRDLLHKRLMDNPYWEEDFRGQDCKNKACQLNLGLISFEHDKYKKNYINYSYNKGSISISNSYNRDQLYKSLRKDNIISTDEYLTNKYKEIDSFCVINEKDYFAECVTKNSMKSEDINKIENELNDFMTKYLNNQDLGRLSKNLEQNLHEFRTSVSESREFRILYTTHNSKLHFLNCFIKRQQKTPEKEKELGRRLRDMVSRK